MQTDYTKKTHDDLCETATPLSGLAVANKRGSPLTEASFDVILGAFVFGGHKDALAHPIFDQFPL